MSVIFETLQKIKHSANRVEEEESPVSGRRRKSCSVKRAYLPLGVITGIGAGLLAFFLWSSWGLNHVSKGQATRKDAEGRTAVGEPRAIAGVRTQATESPGLEANMLPPPPNLTAEHVSKGKLYLAPATPGQGGQTAQYLPPAQDEQGGVVRKIEKKELRYASPPENQGGKRHKTAISDPFAGIIKPVKKYGEETAHAGILEDAPAGRAAKPRSAGERKQTAAAGTAGKKARHAEQAQARRKATEESRTAALTRKPEKRSEQGESSRAKGAEKAQVSAVDQNAQMSIMVAKVQQAMRAGDERKVEDLLHTLESLKGKEDPYVMRLKAFWFLKQRKYGMARSLLEELLSNNEDDLDAGINLAILDIKTNHMEAARNRLRAMRRLHEDNTIIPAILEKISN
jgi:hypothetical protein